MKKHILIPTIPLAIAPIAITSCNNSKHEYLVDIQFQKPTASATYYLTVTINLSDWKHNWFDTYLDRSTQTTKYALNMTVDPVKSYLSIRYQNQSMVGPTDFDIIEPELAIFLTDTVSGYTKTYRFTFVVEIVDFKMVNYTFKTLE